MASGLGKTMVPHTTIFVDELPKARTGKLARRAIRGRHLDQRQDDLYRSITPPASFHPHEA